MRKIYLFLMLLCSSLTTMAQFPAPYCSVVNANNIEPITLVQFAGIDQASSNTLDVPGTNHLDYTGVVGNVQASVTYPVKLKGNTNGSYNTLFTLFGDWNHDNDFSDAGETIILAGSVNTSTGVDAVELNTTVTIPATALVGATRIRIMKKFSSASTDPCNNTWGQTQDYTLNVSAPPPPTRVKSLITGGVWSSGASWDIRVPLPNDTVEIITGSTITVDVIVSEPKIDIYGTLAFNATSTNTLTVTGDLSCFAGSTFTPFNGTTGRTITVNGNLLLDGTSDFSKLSTGLLLFGSTAQTVSGSGDMGTGSPVRFISVSNPAGVTFNRPITVTQQINLAAGVINNNTNLVLDNTVGGVTSAAILNQRGVNSSFSAPIVVGSTAVYNVTYIFFTGTVNAAATSGNEIPASNTINALTINNVLGVTIANDLMLTGAAPLTLTSGIITMAPSKTLIATNIAYSGTTGSGASFINGAFALTWGPTSATKTYPIGSSGQLRKVVITGGSGTAGGTAAGGQVAFSIVNPIGGTAGTGIAALTYGRVFKGEAQFNGGGAYNNFNNITIDYGTDDGFGTSAVADRRIAFSASLTGTYDSKGPTTGTATPLVATAAAGTYTLGHYRFGISAGSLPITFDNGAGTNNWGDAINWSGDVLPTNADDVVLPNGSNVLLAAGTGNYFCKNLTINAGASLTSNTAANTLTVGAAAGNNSLLMVDGGLTAVEGIIKVNGNVAFGSGALSPFNFQMSGNGYIEVDGNDGTAAATSVATGLPMFGIGYNNTGAAQASASGIVNLTGGKIRIIDPNYNTASTANSFAVSAASSNANTFNLTGLTLEFGDGVSGTPGQTSGFAFDTYISSKRVRIGNVICNSRSDLAATSRFVQSSSSTANGSDIEYDLTIMPNSEMRAITGRQSLSVGRNLINNGTLTVTGTATASGDLWLGGKVVAGSTVAITTPQTISGSGIFRRATADATSTGLGAVTVDNTGGVSLNIPLTVTATLTLTNGNVTTTNTNLLTVGVVSGTISAGTIARTNGWINGPLKRGVTTSTVAATAQGGLFPVGTASVYRPARVYFPTSGAGNVPSTAGSLTVEHIATNPGNNGLPLTEAAINLNANATEGYWTVIAGNGLAGGLYNTDFTATGFTIAGTPAEARVVKRTLSTDPWTLQGTHVAAVGGVIKRSGLSGFSEFGVAYYDAALPVTLTTFTGSRANNINKLSWTTLTEANNAGFELQRSTDGVNFSKVSFVASRAVNGNSSASLNYSFSDILPLKGNNYYRLNQVDKNGKSTLSNIVVLKGDKVSVVSIASAYPNPAKNNLTVKIASPSAEKLNVVITDMSGKVLAQQALSAVTGDNIMNLNVSNLASGVYFIKVIAAGNTSTAYKFIKD